MFVYSLAKMEEKVMKLGVDKQSHYKEGRKLKAIMLSSIEAICNCGYLSLVPTSSFESHNGGLTVKRSNVFITNDKTGKVVKRLSRKNINSYCNCNACVNNWK